jgi:hypothetical protein
MLRTAQIGQRVPPPLPDMEFTSPWKEPPQRLRIGPSGRFSATGQCPQRRHTRSYTAAGASKAAPSGGLSGSCTTSCPSGFVLLSRRSNPAREGPSAPSLSFAKCDWQESLPNPRVIAIWQYGLQPQIQHECKKSARRRTNKGTSWDGRCSSCHLRIAKNGHRSTVPPGPRRFSEPSMSASEKDPCKLAVLG